MELVLFFGSLAIIALVLFLLDCVFTKRRLKGLEAQANHLGFSFEPSAQPFAGSSVEGLAVLADASAEVINVMKGAVGQCTAVIFELARLHPACPSIAATTVAAFRCPSGHLPILEIGANTFAHRLGDVIEHKADHDLGQPKQLFVHCADEHGAHEFLTPSKLEHLRARACHFRIESSPDWMFVYRPGVRIRPEALPAFVNETSAIAAGLLGQNSAPAPAV